MWSREHERSRIAQQGWMEVKNTGKAEMGVVGENWAMAEMSAELGRWGLESWD